MAVSAFSLDQAGWTQLTQELQAGQLNGQIVSNIVRHLRELGALTVLVEAEYLDRDFTEAFAAYYSRLFKRHTKLCRRAHFFNSDLSQIVNLASPSELAAQLQQRQDDYLGFLVLRPIHEAPLAQATLVPPSPPAGTESHVLVKAKYETHVLGAKLTVKGLPMTQQDQRIGACAQATIWSASRHFHARHKGPWMSTVGITEAAMMQEFASVSSTIPNGSEFLSLNGMVSALRTAGRKPLMYIKTANANPTVWQGIRPVDVINRYVDSGIPVILGLNLGGDIGHAVIASGQVFTHQAPVVAALPNNPTRAAFCSAFYVNDDQQGPNLRMPVQANDPVGETPYNVHGNLQFLLIPLPDKVFLPAEKAEVVAWDMVQLYRDAYWPQLKQHYVANLGTSEALGDAFLAELGQNAVVARTYLTYGWKYKHRLLRNRLTDAVHGLARGTELPRYVWVTEFGTVDSFSPANIFDRRIFAHCVVDATAKNMGEDSRLFFHAPGLAISRTHDRSNPNGPYQEAVHVVTDDQAYFPKLRGNLDFAGY